MGNLLVVGSVAFDSVRTPFGEAPNALDNFLVTHFFHLRQFFTDVNLIAVVGEDFPEEHLEFLRSRGIDLEGLEHRLEKPSAGEGNILTNAMKPRHWKRI